MMIMKEPPGAGVATTTHRGAPAVPPRSGHGVQSANAPVQSANA